VSVLDEDLKSRWKKQSLLLTSKLWGLYVRSLPDMKTNVCVNVCQAVAGV